MVQFEIREEQLVEVEPTGNLDDGRGVRREDGVVQLGLTSDELDDIYERLQSLLEDIDKGEIEVF